MSRHPRPVPWDDPIKRVGLASLVLVCHSVMAALIITLIWGFEAYNHWLNGNQPRLLFGILPLSYLFDGMDLGVICVYIWYGLFETVRVFRTGRWKR